VEPIARGQIEATDAAARASDRLLVQDTDLVSTVVYSRHYYGDCPAWVEAAARERLGQLYLLLHPDVPWLPDPQRDRGDRRAELHALFSAALERMGARVIDVRGTWPERARAAHAAVLGLLS
jgi:nicotinamide riboside kinase